MKKSILTAIICSSLLAGCGEDSHIVRPRNSEKDTITVTFQDGALPSPIYNGTRDAVLKNGPTPELQNGNFGNAGTDTIGTVYTGSACYERRLILKIDVSAITNCASVIDARLSIRLEQGTSDSLSLEVYEAAVPSSMVGSWREGTGVIGSGVSWQSADGMAPWNEPGGDYIGEYLDDKTVRGDSTVTFSLPSPLVLKWIRYPDENHGIIIKSRHTSEEIFRIVHLRESSTAESRPNLELIYLKSG